MKFPFKVKEKKQMIVFIGIQASGKTTFYKSLLAPLGYGHVNLDTLHTRYKEQELLHKYFLSSKSFVVDNTNPEMADRERYIPIAKTNGYKDDTAFSRKERKQLSLLAAEASATFTSIAERLAVFDNRLIPLPNEESVVDYFRWRQEDAHRNSLNAHCYWLLRKQGLQAVEAQKRISGLLNVEKLNLLLSAGIDYGKIPAWQKYGVGMYFQDVKKNGYNPITKESVLCSRRTLFLNDGLPIGNEYSTFIRELLKHNTNANEQKCFNKI